MPELLSYIIIFLGASLSLIYFQLATRNKMTKYQLEIEDQRRQLSLQRRMLEDNMHSHETEKVLLAQKLHKDIASKLHVVNMHFNLLEPSIASEAKADEAIGHIKTSLTESISNVRDMSHRLVPPVLEKFGLQCALRSLGIQVNRKGYIHIKFDIDEAWRKLSLKQEIGIYRIIEELIQCAETHTHAKNIYIKSCITSSCLKLVYQDDGIGIPDSCPDRYNIKTRADLINAELIIKNDYSCGTEIRLILRDAK